MNFAAIIITFYPEVALLAKNLGYLQQAGFDVCIVDNSPTSCAKQGLVNFPEVQYFFSSENLGIAAAQNVGLKFFANKSYHYVMLLDQDSQLSLTFLEGMKTHAIKLQTYKNIAAFGPQIVCEYSEQAVRNRIDPENQWNDFALSVRQIIASGMMINMNSIQQIGYKEEKLFIDAVDHEWCWRAINQGYEILRLSNTQLLHRQGEGRICICGVTFKKGAPIRLYFQFRNIILLLPRGYVPLYWKIRNVLAMPLRFVVNALFLDKRRKRITYMLKGIIDGCRRRSGKIEF